MVVNPRISNLEGLFPEFFIYQFFSKVVAWVKGVLVSVIGDEENKRQQLKGANHIIRKKVGEKKKRKLNLMNRRVNN